MQPEFTELAKRATFRPSRFLVPAPKSAGVPTAINGVPVVILPTVMDCVLEMLRDTTTWLLNPNPLADVVELPAFQ